MCQCRTAAKTVLEQADAVIQVLETICCLSRSKPRCWREWMPAEDILNRWIKLLFHFHPTLNVSTILNLEDSVQIQYNNAQSHRYYMFLLSLPDFEHLYYLLKIVHQ